MSGRHVDEQTAGEYVFGPFRLDGAAGQLWRGQELVPLTPKAFDTLWVLVTRAGRVVPKEILLRQVWPDSFVGDDTLAQNIATIRKALGGSSDQPEYIVTIPKRGYRFSASVEAVPEQIAVPVGTSPAPDAAPPLEPSLPPRSSRWPSLIAVAVMSAAAVFGLTYSRQAEHPTAPLRFVVHPPEETTLASGGVVSPDGRSLAFVARDPSGQTRLWVRPLDSIQPMKLPGTEGAWAPFWSPDSRFIGFFAEGLLKKVGLSAELPQTLARIEGMPAGGSWSERGVVVVAGNRSGLFVVPDTGGALSPITTPDDSAHEIAHRWPHFLPDGHHFLYFVASPNPDRRGIYIGALDPVPGGSRLVEAGSGAMYAEPGYVLFVRDGALMAQRFDAKTLFVSGSATVIADGVDDSPVVTNGLPFSSSRNGLVTYSDTRLSHLAWFDRAGTSLGTIDSTGNFHNPTLFADDTQLAATAPLAGLWRFDVVRGVGWRFSRDDGTSPVWSPDGTSVVFSAFKAEGRQALYLKSSSGNNEEQLLLRTDRSVQAQDWSHDGRFIVYISDTPATKSDLWLLPLFGEGQPTPYLQTTSAEVGGQISPDGRWMSYASDESGNWEVYIQSFPVAGGKLRVSTHGGMQPRWRRDGKELFYLAPSQEIMSVDVKASKTFEIGVPRSLFQVQLRGDSIELYRNHYAVTSDGKRFLVNTADRDLGRSTITLLSNLSHWIAFNK